MEKGIQDSTGEVMRVVLTGPECTGKTTLAQQLASHFSTIFIPEYAREYVANLCRPYNYEDVVHIAEVQQKQAHEYTERANRILFFDTYLIITKIWFKVVFGRYPEWIDQELSGKTIDLYLLCDTSIPWIADPVRENGGEMREKLFQMYKSELDQLGCSYSIISGTGQKRLDQAIRATRQFLAIHTR
jgi:NadR type nicotinamide-nucleotide adenylyltransferase